MSWISDFQGLIYEYLGRKIMHLLFLEIYSWPKLSLF